jgi:hypothetical protein
LQGDVAVMFDEELVAGMTVVPWELPFRRRRVEWQLRVGKSRLLFLTLEKMRPSPEGSELPELECG